MQRESGPPQKRYIPATFRKHSSADGKFQPLDVRNSGESMLEPVNRSLLRIN